MLTAVVGFTACSDKFLEEKRNYGNFNAADSYGSAAAATERLNNIYFWLLPVSTGGSGNGTNAPNDWTSVGNADDWAKSTLEYGGISTMWVNPQEELTYDNVYDNTYRISDEFAVGDGLTADFMLVADPQEMNACYRLTDFYGNNYWTPVMKTAEAAE